MKLNKVTYTCYSVRVQTINENILFKASFRPYVAMYVPNQHELVINDK